LRAAQQASRELKDAETAALAEREGRLAAEAEVRALNERVRLSSRQADVLDERLQVGYSWLYSYP